MAGGALAETRGRTRRDAEASGALGRLSREARVHRVLAGPAQPVARPHRVQSFGIGLGRREARAVSKIEAYAPPRDSKPLSPTELLGTLRAALDPWEPGTPFWIFAYGSLMWNPEFAWDARHVAT